MSLQDETKIFIDKSVRRIYGNAIKVGAKVTDVKHIGLIMYQVSIGNLNLIYAGNIDGTAVVACAAGNVFNLTELQLMDKLDRAKELIRNADPCSSCIHEKKKINENPCLECLGSTQDYHSYKFNESLLDEGSGRNSDSKE